MKIGVLLDYFAKGGVAKLTVQEVEEFIKQGYEAELVILWRYKNDLTYSDLYKRVPCRFLFDELPSFLRINFKIPFFSFFCFFHLSSFIFLPLLIKKGEYDVLIPHGTYTCFSAIGGKIFRKIPYVAYIHDSLFFIIGKAYVSREKGIKKVFYKLIQSIGYYLDGLIFSQAKGVAKQTNFEIDYIKKRGGKVVLAVPPATSTRLKTAKENYGEYFLIFSKWDFSKNLTFLMDVIENLRDENIHFLLAGQWHPPEYKEKIIKLINDKKINHKITIVGEVDENQIPELFSNAIALVHPLFESWGSTLYESACNCTTFIAVKETCIDEYLKNSIDCFYLEANDLKAYCDKIKLLNNDRGLAQKMGKNAWISIEKIDILNHNKLLLKLCS